jgi:hypothetical protein
LVAIILFDAGFGYMVAPLQSKDGLKDYKKGSLNPFFSSFYALQKG